MEPRAFCFSAYPGEGKIDQHKRLFKFNYNGEK